ncbi:hypothetical protein ACFLSQ_05685 [Bacteroidota bacterium]
MEYSKLIHDFTDGTLESVQEDELFDLLSSDEESRSEFKQQLAMKSAIRTDAKAYTPAAESTLKIFSSLGFATPVSAPIGTTTGSSGSAGALGRGIAKSTGFYAKYGAALITGVVTTVTTAVIAYFIFQSQIGDLNNKNSELTTRLNESKNQSEIPIVQGQEITLSESNTMIPEEKVSTSINKPIIKYVYITKDEDEQKQTEAVISDLQDEISEPFNVIEIFIPDKSPIVSTGINSIKTQKNNILYRTSISSVPIDISSFLAVREKMGITLEFKKMENWFDINPTINPKEYSKFNNTSLSVLYEFIKNLHIGGEVRQETYFQRFSGVENDTLKFSYDQQPNFTSYGLLLRYANKDFNLWGIYPYLQGFAGGTNVGYIGRLMGGLKYSPYEGIVFIIGAETSGLFYKHGGTDFDSYKYDLNYGMSFEF